MDVRICLLLIACLSVSGVCEVDDGSVLHAGEATFYGEGSFGHCGFPVDQQPRFHGAMNHTDYDTAAACGTWVQIWGPQGEVVAFIDDECPECKPGDIDLGPVAFAHIAEVSAGRVPITWRYCEAPVEKPLQIYWKDGSSRWHIEVQVRNHRYGITALEIKTQTSEYALLNRRTYNFFILPGGIDAQPGPYTIRITDIHGRQVVVPDITLEPEAVVETNLNFPTVSSRLIHQNTGVKSTKKAESFIISPMISPDASIKVPDGCSKVALYTCSGKLVCTVSVKRNRITIPLSGLSIFVAVPAESHLSQ